MKLFCVQLNILQKIKQKTVSKSYEFGETNGTENVKGPYCRHIGNTPLANQGGVCWDGKSVQNHMDLESTEECLCVAAGTRMVSSSHRYRRTKAVQPQTALMLMTYFSCISKSLLKVGGVWILWAVPMLLFFCLVVSALQAPLSIFLFSFFI